MTVPRSVRIITWCLVAFACVAIAYDVATPWNWYVNIPGAAVQLFILEYDRQYEDQKPRCPRTPMCDAHLSLWIAYVDHFIAIMAIRAVFFWRESPEMRRLRRNAVRTYWRMREMTGDPSLMVRRPPYGKELREWPSCKS